MIMMDTPDLVQVVPMEDLLHLMLCIGLILLAAPMISVYVNLIMIRRYISMMSV